MKEEGKGCRLNDPCARPRRCVRDGGPGFVAVVRVCGLGRGCVSVRPGFSMCRGGAPGGDQELLVQLRAGRILFWLCGAVVLRCAVLCLKRPGPWAPPAGHGVAWPMEVEVGIFSLAWMGMEREGP